MLQRSSTFAEKNKGMEEKKWITTEQMLENLENEPDVEQQYCHYICGILRSTHWLRYSTKKNQYGDSMDMEYDWYTKDEFLEMHSGEWWMRED